MSALGGGLMSLGDYEAILTEIATEWGIAEEEIKLAEQVHRKVVIPAIKELRYAGRRLADALSAIARDAPREEIMELLADARFNCHCARHDSIDASIGKISGDLNLALDRLGHEAVLGAFPEYSSLLRRVQQTQTKIVMARKKRETRRDIYAELQEAEFPHLVAEYRKFQSSEKLMKKIAIKTRSERHFAYGLAIIGMAVGVLGFMI